MIGPNIICLPNHVFITGELQRISADPGLNPLHEPRAPRQRRLIINIQRGERGYQSADAEDPCQAHHLLMMSLTGLLQRWPSPTGPSAEINYFLNNFKVPHFCDIEPVHSLLIASVLRLIGLCWWQEIQLA